LAENPPIFSENQIRVQAVVEEEYQKVGDIYNDSTIEKTNLQYSKDIYFQLSHRGLLTYVGRFP